jgi:hypothetical protein
MARFRTPRERLRGVFHAQGELFTDPAFNGCAFVRASAETTHGSSIEHAPDDHRTWVRTMFTDLAEEAGVADPESPARQLHLLYDGGGRVSPDGP